MNKTILIGNVGGTPEVRTLDSGSKVATFSLATNENYTKKDGTKVEQTEWHRLEVWGNLANVAETIIKKGDRICIEGKIRTEKWEDKDCNARTSVKIRVDRIELLGKRREEVETQAEQEAKQAPKRNKKKPLLGETQESKAVFEAKTSEGDLPF
ncbi:single-stranded DNA-binding protein [Emticicia sediminis]